MYIPVQELFQSPSQVNITDVSDDLSLYRDVTAQENNSDYDDAELQGGQDGFMGFIYKQDVEIPTPIVMPVVQNKEVENSEVGYNGGIDSIITKLFANMRMEKYGDEYKWLISKSLVFLFFPFSVINGLLSVLSGAQLCTIATGPLCTLLVEPEKWS